jgi:hypothetical protein
MRTTAGAFARKALKGPAAEFLCYAFGMFSRRRQERQIEELRATDAMIRGSIIDQCLKRGAPQPIADAVAFGLHPFDSVSAPREGEEAIRGRAETLAADLHGADLTNTKLVAAMLTSAFEFYVKQVEGDSFYTDRFTFGVTSLRSYL